MNGAIEEGVSWSPGHLCAHHRCDCPSSLTSLPLHPKTILRGPRSSQGMTCIASMDLFGPPALRDPPFQVLLLPPQMGC